MYYRELGKTGKKVSAVSFGSMRFKAEDYKDGPGKCADIVLRGRELGINLFDTAPAYCDDQSEIIVGHAIKQMKEKPYVSTKVGFGHATTADEAYERVHISLERLNMDKITFYQMWCIQNMDGYRRMTAPGGIYEGLLRAKEEGLIEHICCSSHLDAPVVKDLVQDGLVESVILSYNALNHSFRREGVKACYDAGLGVIIMNPLGGGLIPRFESAFSFLKSTPDESIVHAALRFLLGQKEITCLIPGPSSIAEVEECVAAADREREISEELLQNYAKHLPAEFNTLCTGCGYCTEHCPERIPIVPLLSTYNFYLINGDKSVFNHMWGASPADAHKCTACGICETYCTQHLPISQRLAEIGGFAK